MFAKSFRVKSNTSLRSSERKQVKACISTTFGLGDAEVSSLIPPREPVTCARLLTYRNQPVNVIMVSKVPLLFDIDGRYYPTVYLLWRWPGLVPRFITHPQVAEKVQGGADLMLPGVVLPKDAPEGIKKYGNLPRDATVCIVTTANQAAMAVGVTTLTGEEMYMTGGRGKGVLVYHVYGDRLCTSLETEYPMPFMPNLGPPAVKQYGEEPPVEADAEQGKQEPEEVPELVESVKETMSSLSLNSDESQREMDRLFDYCFIKCLKFSGKNLVLPLLTSTFFRSHMVPCCPHGKTLDIKKSSYKKLSKFLQKKAESGIIKVGEQTKGVEVISAIELDHASVFGFEPDATDDNVVETSQGKSSDVIESYAVTQVTSPLFAEYGFHKGDRLSLPEIKLILTDYIKKFDLQDKNDPSMVQARLALSGICDSSVPLSWKYLVEQVLTCMRRHFSARMPSLGPLGQNAKGKQEYIIMTVSKRRNNKRVTLVDNLPAYGIDINKFGKECQKGVAASTTISKPEGKKHDQLLIQGNQVLFVHKLLTEKYGVQQHLIKGLAFAPKTKKK